ncbi:MAG: hypothetical protein JRN08_09925 [Nitrososphaerota archaeon]|nr:hypothetical protein [Nitrososphaerota archaeon]
MRHAEVFGLLTVAALVAMAALVAVYLLAGSPQGGLYGWMMGQMSGGGGMGGVGSGAPAGTWVAFVGIAVLGVVGAVGLAYSLAYPEIKQAPSPQAPAPETGASAAEMSWDVLIRTSKEDEKRVLGVLAAHGGSYLQKFVVKESGLSKLKTHRIVARLAERGVVSVVRSGNTNQVSLAPWVKLGPVSESGRGVVSPKA